MNYENEVEKMKSGAGETFKPKCGQYSVLFMEEPEETIFTAEDGKETPQIKVMVRVDNEETEELWYVSKGLTAKSLYGQLMLIGKAKGKLKGENVTLLVKSAKNRDGSIRNDYTVAEAISLMKELDVVTSQVEKVV